MKKNINAYLHDYNRKTNMLFSHRGGAEEAISLEQLILWHASVVVMNSFSFRATRGLGWSRDSGAFWPALLSQLGLSAQRIGLKGLWKIIK